MHIAVYGCVHGNLDQVYSKKADLILICGDVQTLRNQDDLSSICVPKKYKRLGDFQDYYLGKKQATCLTIFIGGNHESSAYLNDLKYGGWVAPNIYYLGLCGVVKYGNLRIGGISGIYNPLSFKRKRFETHPFDEGSLRTVYHYRLEEVLKLSQLQEKLDIFLSHDWPRNICHYGDLNNLLHKKPFFEQDVDSERLGSPALQHLLHHLQPDYWFSAHLHCKFAALVPQNDKKEPDYKNFSHLPSFPAGTGCVISKEMLRGKVTKFLALDKVLKNREYVQFFKIDNEDPKFEYDLEYLAILRSKNDFESREWIKRNVSLEIKHNFVEPKQQTLEFLQMLGINK